MDIKKIDQNTQQERKMMIPVMQTEFWDPVGKRGNCLQAVIASLLELSLEEVPNFVQDHEDSNGKKDWWLSLQTFAAEHDHTIAYLKSTPESNWPDPEPGEFYTVTGISPRNTGIHHVVIYRDDVMVHDPHPDGTGIALMDAEYNWTLRLVSQ